VKEARELWNKADRQFRGAQTLRMGEVGLLMAEGRKRDAMRRAVAMQSEFQVLPKLTLGVFMGLLAKVLWRKFTRKKKK